MKNIFKLLLMCIALLAVSACTNLDETLVGEVGSQFNGEEPDFATFNGGGAGPSDAVSSAFNQLRESGETGMMVVSGWIYTHIAMVHLMVQLEIHGVLNTRPLEFVIQPWELEI